jgi:hypothetical protein
MEEAWEFWNTRPNSWQPIETAPKDGTVVIVGRDMGDPWGFVRGYGHFESHAGISGWVCEGFIDPPGNLGLGNPDCWMELPGQRPPEAA